MLSTIILFIKILYIRNLCFLSWIIQMHCSVGIIIKSPELLLLFFSRKYRKKSWSLLYYILYCFIHCFLTALEPALERVDDHQTCVSNILHSSLCQSNGEPNCVPLPAALYDLSGHSDFLFFCACCWPAGQHSRALTIHETAIQLFNEAKWPSIYIVDMEVARASKSAGHGRRSLKPHLMINVCDGRFILLHDSGWDMWGVSFVLYSFESCRFKFQRCGFCKDGAFRVFNAHWTQWMPA